MPVAASAVAVQEDGAGTVAISFGTGLGGPVNPTCTADAVPPRYPVGETGRPTDTSVLIGRSSLSCSGTSDARTELWGVIQFDEAADGSWVTLADTQEESILDASRQQRVVEPVFDKQVHTGHGDIRTRTVARFTYEYAVEEHEVRDGCAKTGTSTIVCVVWSGTFRV